MHLTIWHEGEKRKTHRRKQDLVSEKMTKDIETPPASTAAFLRHASPAQGSPIPSAPKPTTAHYARINVSPPCRLTHREAHELGRLTLTFHPPSAGLRSTYLCGASQAQWVAHPRSRAPRNSPLCANKRALKREHPTGFLAWVLGMLLYSGSPT